MLGLTLPISCIPRYKLCIQGEISVCEAYSRAFELFVYSLGVGCMCEHHTKKRRVLGEDSIGSSYELVKRGVA